MSGSRRTVQRLEPGLCTCILGDPRAGSQSVNVLRLGGPGVLLEPSLKLGKKQFVYTSVKLEGGPALALTGVVLETAVEGIWIEWEHTAPADGEKVDQAIREWLSKLGKEPREEEWAPPGIPPPAADARPAAATRPAAGAKPAGKAASAPRPASLAKTVPPQKPASAASAAPAAPAAPPPQAAAPAPKTTAAAPAPPAPPANPAPKRPAPAPKGKLDLKLDAAADSIRKKARTVRSRDLASKLETVQVLDMGTIKGLIKEAVDDSVALLGESLGEAERRRLLEEAEEAFRERIELYESQKAGLEEKSKLLQKQLEKAQAILEGERQRVVSANQFTVSDSGMVELEQRLGRMLDHAIVKGQVSDSFETEMRAVVVRLLDDERKKIQEKAQEAQNDAISLLEKKVQRLAASLKSAETERDRAQRLAQALEASGVISFKNVLTAGLAEGDPERERKLSLLKDIVRINKELRSELAANGRLPQPRSRPAVPKEKAGPDPAAPSGEESRIAGELGVKRAEAAPFPPPLPDKVESVPEGEESPTPVPAAAEAEEDPDDLLWEPAAEEAGPKSKTVKIKRLGG